MANNLNYIHAIEEGRLQFEEEMLTESQKVNERIMTSLRTSWGLRISELGIGNAELIRKALKGIDSSYYIMKEDTLVLTDEGKLFADAIASSLFVDE